MAPCPFVQTLFAIGALPAVIHTLVTQETARVREWAEANIVGCPHKRSLEVTQSTKGVVEPLCTVRQLGLSAAGKLGNSAPPTESQADWEVRYWSMWS